MRPRQNFKYVLISLDLGTHILRKGLKDRSAHRLQVKASKLLLLSELKGTASIQTPANNVACLSKPSSATFSIWRSRSSRSTKIAACLANKSSGSLSLRNAKLSKEDFKIQIISNKTHPHDTQGRIKCIYIYICIYIYKLQHFFKMGVDNLTCTSTAPVWQPSAHTQSIQWRMANCNL